MSLLSYVELIELVKSGVIDAPEKNINPASVEVTVGNRFYIEKPAPWIIKRDTLAIDLVTDLSKKQNISLELIELEDDEVFVLKPGQVCLAETVEQFNLPNDIVSEFSLKSSQARNFWSHELAGYCDPGWHGSKLTMEYKNSSQHGYLAITPGQKGGQMKFVRVTEVPEDKSYAVVGQYNKQTKVQQSKGIE